MSALETSLSSQTLTMRLARGHRRRAKQNMHKTIRAEHAICVLGTQQHSNRKIRVEKFKYFGDATTLISGTKLACKVISHSARKEHGG